LANGERPELESETKKKRLMEKIKSEAIVTSKEPIILSSHKKTHFYYDIKKIMGDPESLELISELMYEEVRRLKGKSVGGLEIGAIPIATSLVLKALENDAVLKSFTVRKKVKEHGMKNKIEGNLVHPVVIVDDVITKGRSIKEAIDAVRDKGKSVRGVIAVIDREEKRFNMLKRNRIKYVTLFKHSEFKEFIEEKLKDTKLQC
jgi:orotate phosphoribosyltransferase